VALATSSIQTRWSPRLALQFLLPAVTLVVGMLAATLLLSSGEQRQAERLLRRLAVEAAQVARTPPWGEDAVPGAEACTTLAQQLEAEVAIVDPGGSLVCQVGVPEPRGTHGSAPEIRQAQATGRGTAVRWHPTIRRPVLYAAARGGRGTAAPVVRLALPLPHPAIAFPWGVLLAALGIGSALAVVPAVVSSRRTARRIRRLEQFAGSLAAGEPPPYLAAERADHLGRLEARLGEMGHRVAATIAELRVEQERLEAILRGMVEGVLVTDLSGGVVLMNKRARDLLGITSDVATRGQPLVELTRDPVLGELIRELAAGAAIASHDVTLGGGSGPVLQVNGARLRGADERPFGFVLVLHDVTELRRLEVIRRDFVANVSHELRTPLTAIKGYAETLLGPAGDDRETARKFLGVIDRHSERLGRLINDLLTLSDLELGRTPLRLVPVAVGVAIDDVLQIFAEPVQRAQVHLRAEVEPGLPAVLADGDRLRQVLINLVDNAIKYTPGGGQVVVRAVSAGAGEHLGMVEIAVEDTGIGIPAQDLPRLTERFFRVDKARSRELGGTGLGLAIVKHIVQAHGGSLAISSALGQGTTVRVYFPIAVPAGETAQREPRAVMTGGR